jgi:hypothetical protein
VVKVFWILYVMTGVSNSSNAMLLRFDAQVECEAARDALVKTTSSWWSHRVTPDKAVCVPVPVRE